MARNPATLKDRIKLRWEYLQCSPKYKDFCVLIHTIEKNKSGPDFSLIDEIELYYSAITSRQGGKPPDDEYSDWWGLYQNWECFRDVHKTEFDDWWKERNRHPKGIVNLRDPDVMKKINRFTFQLKRFKQKNNRQPTAEEFLSLLCFDSSYIFCAIPVKSSMKEIDKTIKYERDVWKEKVGKNAIRNDSQFKFTKRLEYAALKDYLDAYNHRKANPNMSWRDIIIGLDKESKRSLKNISNVEHKYIRYVNIAEKIVSNVERFEFPGEY